MLINARPVTPFSVLNMMEEKEKAAVANQPNPMLATSFEQALAKALQPVNDLQIQSADLDAKLAEGKLEYVHQAMVMSEKASLALDLTIQIRNKVIEAYQEIMRTSV
ncbi:MAG: flagellar hook-basal body complex protein FliE [Firmicutes bacterium]|nr:flagellar hook-basal body complex protein FliE [Bacillota bacterium]